jgi:RHS repeat-associated protein
MAKAIASLAAPRLDGPKKGFAGSACVPCLSIRTGTASRFQHADRLGGNVRQTSASQSVTSNVRWDAFGMLASQSGTQAGPFGFAGGWGYQQDGDSGLQLLGHRYYDPSTGRFLTRDPIKDGRNWYTYCHNNPLKWVDPSGLVPGLLMAQAIGSALGAMDDKGVVGTDADGDGLSEGSTGPIGVPGGDLQITIGSENATLGPYIAPSGLPYIDITLPGRVGSGNLEGGFRLGGYGNAGPIISYGGPIRLSITRPSPQIGVGVGPDGWGVRLTIPGMNGESMIGIGSSGAIIIIGGRW